jgi:hypothetical protein
MSPLAVIFPTTEEFLKNALPGHNTVSIYANITGMLPSVNDMVWQ